MVEQWVKDLTEATLGVPLAVGMITKHPSGRIVQIADGQYWGTHGISNFWYWQEIMLDGSLSANKERGYGWQPTEVYYGLKRKKGKGKK